MLLKIIFNIFKFKCKKMTINKININVDEYYTYDDIKLLKPPYDNTLIKY